jgi:tRNA1(Val) A37 N6-methylase TrmN6
MSGADPAAKASSRTHGHLLDGRVRYAQPAEGYRSGIEPVLLAAAVPARPGQRVLEAGSGAGATLLCLAARIGGVQATGIELDPELVALARDNAAANDRAGVQFIAADIAAPPPLGEFDHACANPPYHIAAGTRPADRTRDRAKHGGAGLLRGWVQALAAALRPRGTLTLILPSVQLPEACAELGAAKCSPAILLPLWPKARRQAKLAIVQGIKGGAEFRVLPGLVLHEADGAFTAEAQKILRDGEPLAL